MEYSRSEYKNKRGNVFTTTDGHKYTLSKERNSVAYLKCILFRESCPSTAKLNMLTNKIAVLCPHNHDIDTYHAEKFKLRTKCKIAAKNSTTRLRELFDDTTRQVDFATEISFKSCELIMYRARRETQPKIPKSAFEFSTIIKDCTNFGQFNKATVVIGEHCSVIFYSENMHEYLSVATNVFFDGTFKKCPKQFFQLWTLFVEFGRYVLPAIHCLLTSKSEDIYTATLLKIKQLAPQLSPSSAMGDWEPAARNAIKTAYPSISLYGCWFHHNQAILKKITKLGLVKEYHANDSFKNFLKSIMNLPLLPSEHIEHTFDYLTSTFVSFTLSENIQIEKFKRYYKHQWLTRIGPSQLSVFKSKVTTNNGAESYHAKINKNFKSNHPNIWVFCETLNNIIVDTDAEIGRLNNSLEIFRSKKKDQIKKDELREICRENLVNGTYTPIEFITALHTTLDSVASLSVDFDDNDSDSGESEYNVLITESTCCICLQPREDTICFRPCSHARVCSRCDQVLKEENKPCPICRYIIQDRFKIY